MAEYTYASNGKGNLGVTLGAIGTGLNLLQNGGLGGLNLFGGNNQEYATKSDLENAIIIAQKDNEITLLKSESNTEKKIIDTYKEITERQNKDREAQATINAQQAVYNSTLNSTANVLSTQVNQLMSLCQLRIPNSSVCPGWGAVAVNPVYTPTGTTAS